MKAKHFLDRLSHIKQANPSSYGRNTLGLHQEVHGVICPSNKAEIKEIIRAANHHQIRLHPLSTGRNWGYGSALSPDRDAVILDLSNLNSIRFNKVEETFTVEPGVTQIQLYQYLNQNDLQYLVPTTGAGPNASILANALERGYGITPIEDHSASIVGMESILADGSDYMPIMQQKSGICAWKWDLGPYIQGLFSQSNLSIVISLTLRLYPKPEVIGIFRCRSRSLNELVLAAKEARSIELVKGINIMNSLRTSSMTGSPDDDGYWTLIGSFYCRHSLTRSMKSTLRRLFGKHHLGLQITDSSTFDRFSKVIRFLDRKSYTLAEGFFSALKGKPTELALNIVGGESNVNDQGLIWYSPVVPAHLDTVNSVTAMINETCLKSNIQPLITYTLVNASTFDATIPILFNKIDGYDMAWCCYDEMLERGLQLGVVPYRLPVNRMDFVKDTTANKINKMIKKALDPRDIFARGRYVI